MARLRELHEEVWHALQKSDFETAERYISEGCQFVVPGASVRGLKRVRPILKAYLDGFPDTRIEVQQVLEDKSDLVVRATLSGEHSDVTRTLQGVISPTGLPVTWEIMEWLTFRDDKITEWRLYQDSTPFMDAINSLNRQMAVATSALTRTVPRAAAADCIAAVEEAEFRATFE